MTISLSATTAFREHFVELDGVRIRYLEAGDGPPLVHFHAEDGLRVNRSHELLAQKHRVILFEVPASRSVDDPGRTMAEAVTRLGIDQFNLMGNSSGGTLALLTALTIPQRIHALILVAPAAILPDNHAQQPLATPDGAELEARMADFQPPVLVIWGTNDHTIPSEMGRVYVEKLPAAFFFLLYDAGHAADADRPEAFADLVTEFVERRAEVVVNRRSGVVHP